MKRHLYAVEILRDGEWRYANAARKSRVAAATYAVRIYGENRDDVRVVRYEPSEGVK